MASSEKKQLHCKSAFTLIELSIVLVIIGLIVGGVLVGQDLIKAAQIRSQIKQFDEYKIAYNTFRLKYNCIPGDCTNATALFGTADGYGNTIGNGNGNGVINTGGGGGPYDNGSWWSGSTEMQGVFHQLSLAGFINFIPTDIDARPIGTSHPAHSLNKNTGFFIVESKSFYGARNPSINSYQNGNSWIWSIDCNATTDTNTGLWDNDCAIFTAEELRQMDDKIDNGNPLSGNLFGFGGYSSNNDCLNSGAYKITNTTPQCQAAYRID